MSKHLRFIGACLCLLFSMTMLAQVQKVPYGVGKKFWIGRFYPEGGVAGGHDTLTIKYGVPKPNEDAFEIICDGENWWKNDKDSFHIFSSVVIIDPSFHECPLKTTANMFMPGKGYYSSLEEIRGLKYLNTDSVTDMSSMFANCDLIVNLDLHGFGTPKVTKMDSMFFRVGMMNQYADANEQSRDDSKKHDGSVVSLDFGDFNTQNVTSMRSMFENAKVEVLDLHGFDTRNVKNMSNMFAQCGELKTIYVGEKWSTDALTDKTKSLFMYNSRLVGGAGTGSNIGNTFYGYEVARVDGGIEKPGLFTSHNPKTYPEIYGVLENLYYFVIRYGVPPKNAYRFKCEQAPKAERVQAVYNYDTNSWVNESGEKLNAYGVDYVEIDSTVRNCSPKTLASFFAAFARANFIEGLENLRTDSVRSLKQMFCGCESLKTLELQSFKTRSVKDVGDMFFGCKELKTIYVGKNWTMSNLTKNTVRVFEDCPNIVGGAGTQWTSSKKTAEYAHVDGGLDNPGYLTEYKPIPYGVGKRCTRIDRIYNGEYPSAGFDTLIIKYGIPKEDEEAFEIICDGENWWKNDKDSFSIFSNIIYIDPSFHECPLKTTANMFNYCYNANEINGLRYINTDSVTDMSKMFAECNTIVRLDLRGFKTPKVTKMDSMFFMVGCRNNVAEENYVRGVSTYVFMDLDEFNTQNVTSMSSMFDNAMVRVLNLQSFDTRNVKDMTWMFAQCGKLKTIYVGEKWSTDALTNKSQSLFFGNDSLVGGMGTKFDGHCTSLYACVDKGESSPGYLTMYTDLPMKLYYYYSAGDLYMCYGRGLSSPYNKKNVKNIIIEPSIEAWRPKSAFFCLFQNYINLEHIDGLEYLVTDSVNTMNNMFAGCKKLESLDLSSFNTSLVTNMSGMFRYCENLKTLNLTSFNTENLVYITDMFTDCASLETIYVGHDWTLSNLTDSTVKVFENCPNLVGGERTQWSSSKISAAYARIDERPDNPGYFTYKGPQSYGIFSEADSTFTIYYGIAPEEAYIRRHRGYSYEWEKTTEEQLPMYGVKTAVIDPSFRTSRENTLGEFFNDFYDLETIIGIENIVTDSVTDMSSMFSGCEKLKSVDLSNFNTSRVKYMNAMFSGCESLTELNVSNFDTRNVEDMAGMFNGCKLLTELNVSNFDTRNVERMLHMFKGCSLLKTLDLENFDTRNVTEMDGMFDHIGVDSLDLRSFDTRKVTRMTKMFTGSKKLRKIVVGYNWVVDTLKVDGGSMFTGLKNLVGGAGTVYDANHIDDTYAHIDGGEENPGYLTGATLRLKVNVENSVGSTVEVSGYKYIDEEGRYCFDIGSTAQLTAVPGEGCVVKCWSDDFRSLETRYVKMTQDTAIAAVFYEIFTVDSAEYIITSVDPAEVGVYHAPYTKGDYTVPEKVEHLGKEFTVTTIKNGAYSLCLDLTSVTIPSTVTSIEYSAFDSCVNLTNVVIPNTVTKIDKYAFVECPKLNSVVIPSSVTTIGIDAFGSSYSGMSKHLTIYCRAEEKPKGWDSDWQRNQDVVWGAKFVTIQSNDAEQGMVLINGKYTSADTTVVVSVNDEKQEVKVEAKPVEKYEFVQWNDGVTDNPRTFAITADTTITAIFEKQDIPLYVLTYKVDGEVYQQDTIAFGDTVVAIKKPTKEGYTFNGWKNVPTTMPAKDVTVTGSFKVKNYVLTYKVDGEVYQQDSIAFGDTVVAIKKPTKEGYTFNGWKNVPTTMPAKNVTVTGSFKAKNYVITYKVDDKVYQIDTLAYGDTIVAAKEPTKEGATFSGWSKLPETMPAKDLIVTGTFSGNSYVITYKVNGKVYQRDTLNQGSTVIAAEEPEMEGYTFSAWENLPVTMPAKNVTVTASFVVNTYALTYKVDGEVYQQDSIAFGDTVVAIKKPTKEGYTFSGWKNVPTTMPAKNVTVTGSFKAKNYVITYKVDDKVYQIDTVAYGETIVAAKEPTKEGATFSGWSKLPETMPAQNLIVTGTFSGKSYVITYKVDGKVYQKDTLNAGSTVVAGEEPKKEGYTFIGWKNLTDTMPSQNVTVTAMFVVNTYALTYKVDGEVYQQDSIAFGDTVVAIKKPTKEGYTFSGWKNVPTTMPAKDVTVTGSFKAKNYVITYKVDDKVYQTDTVAYGETIVAAKEPTKEGATFSGWSKLPETMPAQNLIVTGTFSGNSYVITYKVDGKLYQRDTLNQGSTVIAAEEPEKEGYTFSGWNNLPETMPAKNVTVSGTFSINNYILTYIVDEEVYHIDTLHYGDAISEIEAPEKTNYIFDGWIELPETMPAEDLTVMASFRPYSGVEEYNSDAVRVWTADKSIFIQVEKNASYVVYNMLGHIMAQGVAMEGDTQIAMPAQGVYQVVVEKSRRTVLVK